MIINNRNINIPGAVYIKLVNPEISIQEVDIDHVGNVYVGGSISNIHYESSFDNFTIYDMCIAPRGLSISSYNEHGKICWERRLEGNGGIYLSDMEIDNDGNILITGSFAGEIDFDPSNGLDIVSSPLSSISSFVFKLTQKGDLMWHHIWLTDAEDKTNVHTLAEHEDSSHLNEFRTTSVSTDQSGNVFVAGLFSGAVDLDPGQDSDETNVDNLHDVFICQFSSAGNYLQSETLTNSELAFRSSEVIVNGQEEVIVIGLCDTCMDPDLNFEIQNYENNNTQFIFVTRMSFNSINESSIYINIPNYVIFRTNSSIDINDNIYIAGMGRGDSDFNPELVYNLQDADANRITDLEYHQVSFILKYTGSNSIAWDTHWFNKSRVPINGICIDNNNVIYFSGSVRSRDGGDTDNNQIEDEQLEYNTNENFMGNIYLGTLNEFGDLTSMIISNITGINLGIATDGEYNIAIIGNWNNEPFIAKINIEE